MIQKWIPLSIATEILPHLINSSKWGQKDVYDLLFETGFNSFFKQLMMHMDLIIVI